MTLDDLSHVFGPKVSGCLNLHDSVRSHNVDFFIMLSSGCGIIGNEGQSNYAASSTFLDSFARFRRHLGLPATTVDLGFVKDIGNVGQRPDIHASLESRGFKSVMVKDILRVMDAAIATSESPSLLDDNDQHSYDPLATNQIIMSFGMIEKSTETTQSWARDTKFSSLLLTKEGVVESADDSHNSDTAMQTAINSFRNARNQLDNAPDEKSSESLHRPICVALVEKLAKVLSVQADEIQPTRSAVQYGMDSLIAIDVRSWCSQIFRVDLPMNDLLNPYSIQDLAERITQLVVDNMRSR